MRTTLAVITGMSAVVLAAACGGGSPPPPPPEPAIDSAAIRDSIAQEEAARRAREDSIARARERERIERQRVADSLAAIRRETEEVKAMLANRIHFDFDKSNIRPGEDTEILETKAAILMANPDLRIEIVGHCDERGSDEYNIALGQRRAVSAKQFLVDRGIDESRISVMSRGEEDPIAMGSNEEAWAQNRRDEFIITGGGDVLRKPGM